MKSCEPLTEIYKTANGAIYQCDKKGGFIVDFAGFKTPYNFPCFISLKRKVEKIDLEELLTDTGTGSDIEIINPCGSERVYVLSIAQVAEFKELFAGTKIMLELNSILKERIYSIPSWISLH